LNIFAIGVAAFIILAGGIVTINLYNESIEKENYKDIKNVSYNMEQLIITDNEERLKSYIEMISSNELIVPFLNSDSANDLTSITSELADTNEVDFIIVKGLKSEVALWGNCTDDIKELVYMNLPDLSNAPVTWIDGNIEIGLYMFGAKSLVDENGSIIGTIIAGTKISADKYTNYVKNVFNMDATIFVGDVRESTTIQKDEKRQIGTKLDPKISNVVLIKGENYIGKTTILNIPYVTMYVPILDSNKTPIGILFVGNSLSDLHKRNGQVFISMSILGGILLIISILLARTWLNKMFIKPLMEVSLKIKTVSEGKYNTELIYDMKDYDELQDLYKSFNIMAKEILYSHNKIESIAYFDTLTGMKNRAMLFEKYDATNDNPMGESLKFLMYIDIDELKAINSMLGHKRGDLLIADISKRLFEVVSGYDNYELFRLLGDEFVICRNTDFAMEELHEFAKEVLYSFSEPFYIEGHKMKVTASIGVSYCKNCSEGFCLECNKECIKSLDQLLQDAEIAVYQVKINGKSDYKVFDFTMYNLLKNKAEIENDLKSAIINKEFVLYYQPQYDILTKDFIGFEALIRWEKPGKGLISPAAFIHIAEETGMILAIGKWVLRTACLFVKTINEQYKKEYVVSVNVSVAQLTNDNYVQEVLSAIEEINLNPKFLKLEITESILISSLSAVNNKLIYLKEKGISIALDDFGTGYSSLTYLRELPIDSLKVDKSFIDDICFSNKNIVGDIIRIGHQMNLKVVAEGVEDKEQLDILKQYDCDIIQGYYFSKPLSEKDLINRLNLI